MRNGKCDAHPGRNRGVEMRESVSCILSKPVDLAFPPYYYACRSVADVIEEVIGEKPLETDTIYAMGNPRYKVPGNRFFDQIPFLDLLEREIDKN
jgi:hypothetical protein